MAHPYVTIDLQKIEHNTRTIVNLCRAHGITVTGVTKGTCGHPDVAKAILRGGVVGLGESQLENIQRLKSAGVETSYLLLRLPALGEVDDVVTLADVSLNSELGVLAALSQAAGRRQRVHDVIVMVDLGDLREGVWPADLPAFLQEALQFPGVRVIGVGTNLACFSGVMPNANNMQRFVDLVGEIEGAGITLHVVSGANSSGLSLIAAGRMPPRINHARIGEALLLGRETMHRQAWPDTFQDAFVLHGEILELKKKPSAPLGERSEDAFGHLNVFANHGIIDRALVNVGREEVTVEGIVPCDQRLTILGASSSYLVVDVTAAAGCYQVGSEMTFFLNYAALLTVMTSVYIEKRSMDGRRMSAAR
ncbi:MAG: alanine/ornithine racemase family PLP-dependent enzyme [Candidatus Binatia bacterium]